MKIDKDFTYQVITELRRVGKNASEDDRVLMLGAANLMERNIRAYLDLLENQQTNSADQKRPGNCPFLICPFADKCTGLCDWAAGR